eukprot:CAMPEP_0174891656 /NCGR_PEP_ID=MMETSP0167-20121228/6707_1 /TAXON_ID=38298 /ORGANISM="Rhodella maculata, Strain CCMP736" /LENGTH=59 /DNA_ID=CAMNT_0016129915 /DNA_START=1164 /DNA_END=1343 /DNA_ORIENTATION=-
MRVGSGVRQHVFDDSPGQLPGPLILLEDNVHSNSGLDINAFGVVHMPKNTRSWRREENK